MDKNLRGVEVNAHYNPGRETIDLYGFIDQGEKHGSNERYLKVVATGEPCDMFDATEPFLSLGIRHGGTAQKLIDSLWHAGLRPSQSVAGPVKNELERVERHLADMRQLAFAALEVTKPE